MGAGIAHAFLLAGSRVTVVERDRGCRGRGVGARARVRRGIRRPRHAPTTTSRAIAARFATSTDVDDFAGCGLVVEAVPEDLELKIDALTRVEAVLAARRRARLEHVVDLDRPARRACSTGPSRFLGMHFFNPVPASTLVEIVRGDATDGDARRRGARVGRRDRQDRRSS